MYILLTYFQGHSVPTRTHTALMAFFRVNLPTWWYKSQLYELYNAMCHGQLVVKKAVAQCC